VLSVSWPRGKLQKVHAAPTRVAGLARFQLLCRAGQSRQGRCAFQFHFQLFGYQDYVLAPRRTQSQYRSGADRDGRVEQSNFDTYQMLRMNAARRGTHRAAKAVMVIKPVEKAPLLVAMNRHVSGGHDMHPAERRRSTPRWHRRAIP
jgi:hypothetical protein